MEIKENTPAATARILIVDDDRMLCNAMSRHINYLLYKADCAYSLDEGFDLLSRNTYDVVLLDVRLPDGNGIEALSVFMESESHPEVIIITGEGSAEGVESAIIAGAWDYLVKPVSMEKLTVQLAQAMGYRTEKEKTNICRALERSEIAGDGGAIKACLDFVAEVSDSDTNVLITGETGTGKEIFCRAIHENSDRRDGNLVVVDCAALPETLIESTLFGHLKGAFTSAEKAQVGLVEQADGGTLFLDEIGELSMTAQKVFLRVLEEHRFRPVGSKIEKPSNFRLISATNRNLESMVRDRRFRKDLFYRINSQTLNLPPLRERLGDIRTIAGYHIDRLCRLYAFSKKEISTDFISTLEKYTWPGNVRELVHTIETVLVSARNQQTLYAKHLPSRIRVFTARKAIRKTIGPIIDKVLPAAASGNTLPSLKEYRRAAIDKTEKQYLQELFNYVQNDTSRACKVSGLSRSRLYELLKKHRLSIPSITLE